MLETFTQNETKVLAALSHFVQPVKNKWITEITNLNNQITQTALEDLTDRSIIISNDDFSEFFLPSLASLFMQKYRSEIVLDIGGKLIDRAYFIVLQNGGENNYDGFKILDLEWKSITSAISMLILERSDRLQLLHKSIYQYLYFSGRWDEWMILNRELESRARASDEFYDAGRVVYQMGMIYFLQNCPVQILECADQVEIYWKNTGKKEKAAIGQLRGAGYRLLNNPYAAIETLSEVLLLRRSTNNNNLEVAVTLNDLASSEREIGNMAAAENHLREAIRIGRRKKHLETIALSTCNMARVLLEQKNGLKLKDMLASRWEFL